MTMQNKPDRDLTGQMIAMVKEMTSEERKELVEFMRDLVAENKGENDNEYRYGS